MKVGKAQTKVGAKLDDPAALDQIEKLKDLCRQAEQLRDSALALCEELNRRIQAAQFVGPRDRRKRPRR